MKTYETYKCSVTDIHTIKDNLYDTMIGDGDLRECGELIGKYSSRDEAMQALNQYRSQLNYDSSSRSWHGVIYVLVEDDEDIMSYDWAPLERNVKIEPCDFEVRFEDDIFTITGGSKVTIAEDTQLYGNIAYCETTPEKLREYFENDYPDGYAFEKMVEAEEAYLPECCDGLSEI